MPTIVHFDISADNPERAKKFYEELFSWKIEKVPGPMPYYLIETADLNGEKGVGGGRQREISQNKKLPILLVSLQWMNILPRLKNLVGK